MEKVFTISLLIEASGLVNKKIKENRMSRKPTTRSDRLAMENCLRDLVKKQQQRIAELEEQLKNARKETEKLQNYWNKLKNWTKSDGFIHLTSVKQMFLEKMAKIEKGE
jgi:small-conductance mechanosensitive channel